MRLEVNGRLKVVSDDLADVPLAYVLRNDMDLKSVRLGCALEQCGSCKVLVDGEPEYTCATPAGAFVGRSLRTVEGLDNGPVQQVLVRHNAGQCGFCLSGVIVAATALFAADPQPGRDAIVAALDPHLCRCGAHPRIIRALLALADRAPTAVDPA